MLSPRAVKQFRARKRVDFSRWKRIGSDRLLEKREALIIRPPVWNKMRIDQKVCLVIGAQKKRFAFFNETGTGKTFLSIALIRYFRRANVAGPALVLVPNKQNKWEWLEEGFAKHAPNQTCIVLNGSSENKWKQIEENSDADAFIETYAGLVRMVCDLKIKTTKKGRRNKKPRLIPNRKRVQALCAMFKQVYLDESTYAKNKSKLPWRICNKLSESATCFFILTATPFGRNVEDVWGQAYLVDRGYTLGETLTMFRQTFYDTKINFWGGYEYKMKKGTEAEISAYLDNISIAYPADETTMPQLSRVPRYVSLGETAESYYAKAKAAIIAGRGNFKEMQNAFLRMRQISSGFVGYRDDESGDRASFTFPRNPKLELLQGLVQSFKPQHKFIVFHDFLYSGRVISEALDALEIKHVTLNGNTKDGKRVRSLFRDDDRVQGIVLSNSAGGYGLNLQNAKYGIYYESPVGAILRKQTEKRFDRQYSLHKKVTLFDLIVRGTADESILEFHAQGRSLWDAILNDGPHII